jgi:hypothetical protein
MRGMQSLVGHAKSLEITKYLVCAWLPAPDSLAARRLFPRSKVRSFSAAPATQKGRLDRERIHLD